jgi:ribosome-associated protein
MTVPSIGLLFDIYALAYVLVDGISRRCIRCLPVNRVFIIQIPKFSTFEQITDNNLTVKVNVKKKASDNVSAEALKNAVTALIQDKKGKSIICLDLREIPEAITDYFIICHGDSTTQVKAIAGHIADEVWNRTGVKPLHTEGTNFGEWALIDLGEVIVHVFIREKREFYQLEDLWHDAKKEIIPDDN